MDNTGRIINYEKGDILRTDIQQTISKTYPGALNALQYFENEWDAMPFSKEILVDTVKAHRNIKKYMSYNYNKQADDLLEIIETMFATTDDKEYKDICRKMKDEIHNYLTDCNLVAAELDYMLHYDSCDNILQWIDISYTMKRKTLYVITMDFMPGDSYDGMDEANVSGKLVGKFYGNDEEIIEELIEVGDRSDEYTGKFEVLDDTWYYKMTYPDGTKYTYIAYNIATIPESCEVRKNE